MIIIPVKDHDEKGAFLSWKNPLKWLVDTAKSVAENPAVRAALLTYLSYSLLDTSPQTGKGPLADWFPAKWRTALRHLPNFHWTADYFKAKLHKTAELSTTDKPYLFCYHPHGVISMGACVSLGTNGCHFDSVFPGIPRRSVTLNLLFKIPIFREYMLSIGYVSADKKTLRRYLQSGTSIVLIPGGAAEALHAHADCMELVAYRRGFVQLAYECQVPIVPCVGFGENRAFATHVPSSSGSNSSLIRSLQRAWCRWTTFSLPLLTSLWPQRSPLDVVVGAPVWPASSVEAFHKRYWEAVRDLYDTHKGKYGYQDISLVLLER